MANTAILAIRIISDAKNAQQGIDQTTSRLGRFQSGLQKAVVPAAAAGAALIGFGISAVKAASELQQSQGAVQSVFGKSAAAVEKFASTSADRLGVAKSEYLNSAALMGSALQNAGYTAAQAAGETDKAFSRSADLAATFGGTAAEAMDAINAAVSRGEFDPLEKYAVSLNMTAVNAELARRGQDKLTGSALKHAKAQVVLEQIYAQTNKVQGQFAREASTVEGAQQRATAAWTDARAELGARLMPAVTQVTQALTGLVGWVSRNTTTVQVMLGVVAGLSAAILGLNGALKAYAVIQQAVTVATTLWNNSTLILQARLLAMAAAERVAAVATTVWNAATRAAVVAQNLLKAAFLTSPWGWVVLAIVAIIAAIVLIAKKTNWFQKAWKAAWGAIKAIAGTIAKWLKSAWSATMSAIRSAVSAVVKFFRSAWQGAVSAVRSYINVWRAVVAGVFSTIRGLVRAVTAVFRGDWRGAIAAVRSIVSGFGTMFRSIFRALPAPVREVATAIGSTLRNAFNTIRGAVSGLGSALAAPFNAVRSAISSAIGMVQSLISWLSKIKVPNVGSAISKLNPFSLPIGLPPEIPHLARGGIVRTPTLALVGEAGPEAVVPLSGTRPATYVDQRTFITVDGALDPDRVAVQIRNLLNQADRRRHGVTLPRRAGARIITNGAA